MYNHVETSFLLRFLNYDRRSFDEKRQIMEFFCSLFRHRLSLNKCILMKPHTSLSISSTYLVLFRGHMIVHGRRARTMAGK